MNYLVVVSVVVVSRQRAQITNPPLGDDDVPVAAAPSTHVPKSPGVVVAATAAARHRAISWQFQVNLRGSQVEASHTHARARARLHYIVIIVIVVLVLPV